MKCTSIAVVVLSALLLAYLHRTGAQHSFKQSQVGSMGLLGASSRRVLPGACLLSESVLVMLQFVNRDPCSSLCIVAVAQYETVREQPLGRLIL
jgi:hypothetical protein